MPAKKSAAKKAPAKKAPAKKAAPKSMPYEKGAWAAAFSARAPGEKRYWLIKSEPDVFSFDDLLAAPKQTTGWDSVRNSSARNFLRDGMKKGDLAFYYHSNADPSAIVGICEVVREGYPDPTALDPAHDYYDAGSNAETPTWFMVDVKAVKTLARAVALPAIKDSAALREMALVKVGRLSVVPVQPDEWETVIAMSEGRA
ncbi:EVE domain-containing protein [Gemmatimonas sp.]|jgi:predicted RNA-binding protein with PUA-like domain|uniref:EVE domain-containing protein n=1 Tax=Gemmatimonas sp. TaxID=1962908 RepID=UPI0037BF8646